MGAMRTTKSKAKNATMKRLVLVTTCVFFCNLPQSITNLRSVLVVPCHICWRYDVCCYASHGLVCSIEVSSIDLTIFIFLRNVVSKHPIDSPADPNQDVYIGRSEVAMWMRVVSSWACMLLYMWSLWAPVLMPDRYVWFSQLTVNRLSFY